MTPIENICELIPLSALVSMRKPLNWSFRAVDFYRREALRLVLRGSGGALLDYGCGDKPYEQDFGLGYSSWIGVDREVRTSGEGTRNRADVFLRGGRTPLEDAAFDVVLSTQVLEHVEDHRSSLAEIARLLKPGGRAVLTLPMTSVLHEEPNDFRRFTPYGIAVEAARAGLVLERTIALGTVISVVTTLVAGHANPLRRVPVIGRPLHGALVFGLTEAGLWSEMLFSRTGFKKSSICMDYLFVLSKKIN